MIRRTSVVFIVSAFCVIDVATVEACIWDRDTLRIETEGLPGVLSAIVGRFERNPPLYYEMRLERVSNKVLEQPFDLALYDDAAVANDRLGNADEAIAWIRRKAEQLDALFEPDPDHQYRYHANIGTFYAHRWFRALHGERSEDDLASAIEHIESALEINPDAHFGRERAQLDFLRWARDGADAQSELYGSFIPHWNGKDEDRDRVSELVGLITLGAAWASPEIMHALNYELRNSDNAILGYMAALRALELVESGMPPLSEWRQQQYDQYFEPKRGEQSQVRYYIVLQVLEPDGQVLEEEYRRQRMAADAWHNERETFMLARLEQGKHPDTDSDFWDGYVENVQADAEPLFSDEEVVTGNKERSTTRSSARPNFRQHALSVAGVALAVAALLYLVRTRRQ